MELRPCSITLLDFHHTAGHEANTEEIRREHMSPPLNWGDIGYNMVIESGGTIGWGRDIKYSGSHDPGLAPDGSGYTMNQRSFAISCIGNFMEDTMSEVQFQGLLKGALWGIKRFNLTINDMRRHKDQYATDCPGINFPWDRLISEVKKNLNGDDFLMENCIIYFTPADFSVALVFANKFNGCAMFCRNGGNVHPDALKAKNKYVIGGSKLNCDGEVYIAGNTATDTLILAVNNLLGK